MDGDFFPVPNLYLSGLDVRQLKHDVGVSGYIHVFHGRAARTDLARFLVYRVDRVQMLGFTMAPTPMIDPV